MPSSLQEQTVPPASWTQRLKHRAKEWLGYRARIFGSLLLGVLSLAILVTLLTLAAREFYAARAATSLGVDRMEMLRTGAWLLSALSALAGLGCAWWFVHRIHARRVAEMEHNAHFARSIINSSPDAILIISAQGVIQSCNPAAAPMFGYEAESLFGKKITTLIPQRNLLQDITSRGRNDRAPFMAFGQKKNFLTFPVEISIAEAPSDGRRLFVVTIQDASERRHSQEAMHHISMSISSMTGEEFIRSLLQQLSQLLPNDFAFILERDAAAQEHPLLLVERGRILNHPPQQISGTAFEEAFASGIAAYSHEVRARFPSDTLLASLQAESFIATRLNNSDGSVVGLIGFINRAPMENIGAARQTLQIFATRAAAEIARKHETQELASEKERLHGDFAVMRDTAERERRRYEEDIAAEQEMLAVTLRSIREGCITTDNDGRIMTINPVAEELTGWTLPEGGDRHVDEILTVIHKRTRRPIDRDVLRDHPEQFTSPLLLCGRDGSEHIVEISAAPIRNRQDLKLGTVYVFRDITEKHRLEEERQKAEKLESLGLAAGGIAHDFNNLLTAIIGNLSLSMMNAPVGARERIEASKKASLRAQELAQQLLTFAKGGAPIKRTASMRQLLLDTVGFSLSGTNSRMQFTIPEDLWPVDVDAGQISQVISNLAVNAVQAMSEGGTLYVAGENIDFTAPNAPPIPPTLIPGRYVRIEVQDEGPGIPEEIAKKIFDPYFTTKPKGSGLGLATSYSIIKNHDGIIQLESNPSIGGARFILHIPASEAEIIPEEVAPVVKSARKGKILVLDDEEIICELVAYALTPLGYTVEQALDAPTAIAKYQTAMNKGIPFDVVIMDLTIPGGMGGKDAVVKLREIDPNVRAIVSSGYAMDPIMSRYRDHGFAGVIAKPYDVAELEQAVASVLN